MADEPHAHLSKTCFLMVVSEYSLRIFWRITKEERDAIKAGSWAHLKEKATTMIFPIYI